jgi:hypothetical protein
MGPKMPVCPPLADCTSIILNRVGKNPPKTGPPYGSLFFCIALFFGILFTGCSAVSSHGAAQDMQLFDVQELSAPYNQITLKKSLTLDAIPKIRRSKDEGGSFLAGIETASHSDRVVASLGQSRDESRMWFNMVTFDRYRLNVIRKYFFVVDDKAGSFGSRPRRGLRFDCEMVLEKEVLKEPYASENLRRIAILRYVLAQIHKDIKELGDDVDVPDHYNKKLDVCGMLINQTLELILVKLDSSPVLATKLDSDNGIDFDHINFGKGKIRMVFVNDTVAVQIFFGVFARSEK